ncbi:helix-turn-helix transcriptional regulator [Lysinibacillus sp. MHQ-1]|nr:helix-turn-helix transcriptional regulator [Lysinibacillus sp. MHQ-1]
MSRNLAFQLKKIRQQRHLSLDDVAKATGVSKAQLAQIEKRRGQSYGINHLENSCWYAYFIFFIITAANSSFHAL